MFFVGVLRGSGGFGDAEGGGGGFGVGGRGTGDCLEFHLEVLRLAGVWGGGEGEILRHVGYQV